MRARVWYTKDTKCGSKSLAPLCLVVCGYVVRAGQGKVRTAVCIGRVERGPSMELDGIGAQDRVSRDKAVLARYSSSLYKSLL
jgi:hypothetical protein